MLIKIIMNNTQLYVLSNSMQSFVTGLSYTPVLVLIFTVLTSPFESGRTSSTLPRTQDPRGAVLSTTITMSPTVKSLLILVHFCLSCSKGKYSFVHLLQNRLARYWTCFQRRLVYMSECWNSPGGSEGWHLRSKMWLGVRASRSWLSSDTVVMGRLFRIASISQNNVCKHSSSNVCSLMVERRTCLTIRISLSHTPPWCEAAGGLKDHWIPFWSIALLIFSEFQPAMAFCSSFLAPTRLVPLSERI